MASADCATPVHEFTTPLRIRVSSLVLTAPDKVSPPSRPAKQARHTRVASLTPRSLLSDFDTEVDLPSSFLDRVDGLLPIQGDLSFPYGALPLRMALDTVTRQQ